MVAPAIRVSGAGPVHSRAKRPPQHGIVTNYIASLTVLVGIAFIAAAPVGYAQSPTAVCEARGLHFQPTGAIADRWSLTGGPTGPMGCAVSAAQVVPENGQVMQVQNGHSVNPPNQRR